VANSSNVHPTLLVEPDRGVIVVCSNEPYAFVLIMRYTSLSIGDAAGLPKSHVTGDRIITNRDKTEKSLRHGAKGLSTRSHATCSKNDIVTMTELAEILGNTGDSVP
jgi:hypothetical protein